MKNVFRYISDTGVCHEFLCRAPRLAALRAANKFKIPDEEIVIIKNIKGIEHHYSVWSRPIENPSEFQKNANYKIQRCVKRIRKEPSNEPEDPPEDITAPIEQPKDTTEGPNSRKKKNHKI